MTGWTGSTDFPTTSGAYDTSNGGNYDVFVSKLDGGLTSLLASTYLGGSSYDYDNTLALDTSGNVYVTGKTGTDFPTTSGAYDTSNGGNYDVFVSKLDGGLTSLLASTYLGGADWDESNSLTLDTSRNVYVTGTTNSTDFPTTSGAYDTSFNGTGINNKGDAFVSKLDGGLTSLLASTFLGGSSDDYGNSLALDTSGDVYVTGRTESTNFPTTSGAYDTSASYSDIFISKLDSGLTSLLASTYLGGSSNDYCRSLALDTSGNVYVTGYTDSPDFPTTSGTYNSEDVFVSKLNSGLTNLLASTYLGGSRVDNGTSLAIDTRGNVYVTGIATSKDFPTTRGAYDTSFNDGDDDVFVSKLDSDLSAPCKADNIGVDPGDLEVQTGNSAVEIITITCADTVTPVSGKTVKAKVKSGKNKVTVSPGSAVTDENGQAAFTITAKNKTGNAKVTFKSGGIKEQITVNVVSE